MRKNAKLYIAHLAFIEKDIWFVGDTEEVSREDIYYYLHGIQFFANDAEEAYKIAESHLGSDKNHDGPGDLKQYIDVGIHQLEEIPITLDEMIKSMKQGYCSAGTIQFDAQSISDGKPIIRAKRDLNAFQNPAAS